MQYRVIKAVILSASIISLNVASTFAEKAIPCSNRSILEQNIFKNNIQNIILNYGKQTVIELSANNINRINLSPHKVKSIIGDTSKFTVMLSDNHENMFFTSKVPAGESMDLSIIYTLGDVVDLRIDIVDGKNQLL